MEVKARRRRRRAKFIAVEGTVVRFRKRRKVHEVPLPPRVAEFARSIIDILDHLIFDTEFGKKLRNPGAVRSLVLWAYARGTGRPVYKVAEEHGVAPEQLYRIERALKREGVYGQVVSRIRDRVEAILLRNIK